MKKIKNSEVTKKIISQNKAVKKADNTPKTFGDKTPIFLSLHLDGIVEGLELAFCVDAKGEGQDSFMVIALNGKSLGSYDMDWLEHISPKDGTLVINAEFIGSYLSHDQYEE